VADLDGFRPNGTGSLIPQTDTERALHGQHALDLRITTTSTLQLRYEFDLVGRARLAQCFEQAPGSSAILSSPSCTQPDGTDSAKFTGPHRIRRTLAGNTGACVAVLRPGELRHGHLPAEWRAVVLAGRKCKRVQRSLGTSSSRVRWPGCRRSKGSGENPIEKEAIAITGKGHG